MHKYLTHLFNDYLYVSLCFVVKMKDVFGCIKRNTINKKKYLTHKETCLYCTFLLVNFKILIRKKVDKQVKN